MKEKGFTLPELLGVFTLLAVLVLLAVPVVTKNIASGKQNLYEAQINNFKKAASDWMAIHTLEIPDEDIHTTITLGCLKREGLLEESIKNPVTGSEFPNDLIISIDSSSNQYIYTVEENSGTNTEAAIPSEKCVFNTTAIQ